MSPARVSDSSEIGCTTTNSSSGSSETSTLRDSSIMALRVRGLEASGLDDALKELLRPRLTRSAEDLFGRPLLEDDARVEEADAVSDVSREAHLVGCDQHRH